MIDGVKVKNLKVNCDERGNLFEILRSDDDLFLKFGQAYVTTSYPGVVKAWHMHKSQTDYMCVVTGRVKFVLYDAREQSSTYGEINELFFGDQNRMLVQIPPGVYHGFKNIGIDECHVLNLPSAVYRHTDPDEYRLDPTDKKIPMIGSATMADFSILVCGGCGFIGSNFVRALAEQRPESRITVADALSYAGYTDNLGELLDDHRTIFYLRNIAEYEGMREVFHNSFDLVVNFAAETHVDRSLYNTSSFVRANIVGVDVLLALCREFNVPFLQISTDEVYGAAGADECFTEDAQLKPSSPYAASKAAADLLVQAAIRTFSQNVAIVRTTNNYGPRQFPEKLIPFFLHLLRQGQPLPVYGDGLQKRCWLHVEDFCAALLKLITNFPSGEIFNIGATVEYTNLEIVESLIRLTGGRSAIKHVADRPAHDRRYWIDSSKFIARYGALSQRDLRNGLESTVQWYLDNPRIFERLGGNEAQSFEQSHYRQL